MSPGEIEGLVGKAAEAMEKAVAPYSGFRVGAALLCSDGSTYTGCNIENPSLMLSVCAERVAVLKALSEGRRGLRAMALVSGDGGYCYPCGACRQLLIEFAPRMSIFLGSASGIKRVEAEDLLPHPFTREG